MVHVSTFMLYLCFSVTAVAKKYNLKNVPGDLYYDNCGISWQLETLYRENCFMFVSLLIQQHHYGSD